jgi:Zn-dependent protease with chaperone function
VTLAVPAVALILLALPAVLVPVRRHVPVDQYARLNLALLATGVLTLWAGLLMLGFSTLVRVLAGVAALPTCPHVVAALYPAGSSVLGWIAALQWIALSSMLAAEGIRARRRARIAIVEPSLGEHTRKDGFELVVLPIDEFVAYSVNGPTAQVVVSRGLVAIVDDDELAAVIRHERAHATLRHDRLLVLIAAIERALRWIPPVRAATHTVRDALERWADEIAAAGSPAHRDAVERALVDVALATVSDRCIIDRVRERTHSIRRPPGRPRRSLLIGGSLPVALLALFPAWATLDWLSVSHHAIAFGGYCPH